jgi:Rrf2 family protein
MKRDVRLSTVLHALLHMADAEHPLTSEDLAAMVCTNPVVVRRMLAGLREAGLVGSTKGHGGGWQLGRPLSGISLGDVYDALDAPAVFAMADRTENPRCLVEQAVNRAMRGTFARAEAVLLAGFRKVSLADIAADVQRHDRRKR